MKSFLLIFLICSSLFSDMFKIKNGNVEGSFLFPSERKFTDWCDGKYVWREFFYNNRGSLVQVSENYTILIDGKKIVLSKLKECKQRF